MIRLFNLLFISFVVLSNSLSASPLLLEQLSELQGSTKNTTVPDPTHLDPQWWNYFKVEGNELQEHINATVNHLQEVYRSLPIEEQATALPLITKITTLLNALPYAKSQSISLSSNSKPFLKTYSFDKQLELNQHIRKLKLSLNEEKAALKQSKERSAKTQKALDNLLVSYLGQTQPSSKKLIQGLEIMIYGANIGIGEESIRLATERLAESEDKLKKLETELDYSKEHFDVREFNHNELESHIAYFQSALEKEQKELSLAEANLLGIFNQDMNDRNLHLLLEQQLLKASVNKAYAWVNLAFHTLKYNLIMHLNDHFQEKNTLRNDLGHWQTQVDTIRRQAHEWKSATLKELDRIKHEYAALVAQNAAIDPKLLKNNQALQQGVMNIMATLDLLDDQIGHTQWLIQSLETHFRRNSHFLVNWWIEVSDFSAKAWSSIVEIMNYSLFKVSGVPITLLSLLKVLLIIALSLWLGTILRSALISFGRKSGEIGESTLYSLGELGRYCALLVGLVVALCSIGLDFSSLIFLAGAILFGISLGLQSIANNFFCGLRILFERKLQIGDEVELNSGYNGKVIEIHVQNTVVRTSDGQKVIVPNAELIGNTLVNWAKHNGDYRRLHVPFAVANGTDKELVRRLVIEAAKRVPCALQVPPEYDEPQVWLVNFNRHALEFKLVVWVDYRCESTTESRESDFLWEIETSFRQHRIELPTTIHDLFLPHKH